MHDADDLFDGGEPFPRFDERVFHHGGHAVLHRLILDVLRACAVHDEGADAVLHLEHFVDGDAPPVAGVIALRASLRRIELYRRIELRYELAEARDLVPGKFALGLAGLAEFADEALAHGDVHRRCDEEGRHSHVEQARKRRCGVVRVERGEEQVPGERGVHGDRCGLFVADLPYHDDIGVLAEDGTQAGREGEADAVVRLDLGRAFERVFDRVFDRDDGNLRLVQRFKDRIQERRFPGTGRTVREDHAVGFRDRLFDLFEVRRSEPECLDVECLRFGEHAHDHVLAVVRRDDGHAHVHIPRLLDLHAKPAVLGSEMFVRAESGKHLDATHHLLVQLFFDGSVFEGVIEESVDAVAEPERVLRGFDMDIRRADRIRIFHKEVDQLDDGDLFHRFRKFLLDERFQ